MSVDSRRLDGGNAPGYAYGDSKTSTPKENWQLLATFLYMICHTLSLRFLLLRPFYTLYFLQLVYASFFDRMLLYLGTCPPTGGFRGTAPRRLDPAGRADFDVGCVREVTRMLCGIPGGVRKGRGAGLRRLATAPAIGSPEDVDGHQGLLW